MKHELTLYRGFNFAAWRGGLKMKQSDGEGLFVSIVVNFFNAPLAVLSDANFNEAHGCLHESNRRTTFAE